MHSCAANGELDGTGFGKPLPVVGLYIVAASLLCALAIGADILRGIRYRKVWFPCKFLSLNAATLTVLGVATKLPVDLNTPMPGKMDQLSKLSGTALICTIMATVTPSLGDMDAPELASNVIALAILVVTVIVNVCIQMGTGVIYAFTPEHIVVLISMLHQLVILVATALTVPLKKRNLEVMFDLKSREQNTGARANTTSSNTTEMLKERVKKILMTDRTNMAAQLEIALAGPFTGPPPFCLLVLVVLIEATARSLLSDSVKFCRGESDYGLSTTLVFISQAVAIVLGTVPSAARWSRSRGNSTIAMDLFEKLGVWTESPMTYFHMTGRRWRKFFSRSRNSVLFLIMWIHVSAFVLNGVVWQVVFFPLRWFALSMRIFKWLVSTPKPRKDYEDTYMIISRGVAMDTELWISSGRKKKPAKLTELVKEKHSHLKGGFGGLGAFCSNTVPSGSMAQVIENGWALSIVTLVTIAVALPNVDRESIESLLEGVNQGLECVRYIEKRLDGKGFENMRKAADHAWHKLDAYNEWLQVHLSNLVPKGSSNRLVVEKLQEITKKYLYMTNEDPTRWGANLLQANCMYRVTLTILQDYEKQPTEGDSYPFLPRTDDNLFPWLQMTICDILRACLTNLPQAIDAECSRSVTGEGEKRGRCAASLLGQVDDEILPVLVNEESARHFPNEREYIDEWSRKMSDPATPASTPTPDLSAVIIE